MHRSDASATRRFLVLFPSVMCDASDLKARGLILTASGHRCGILPRAACGVVLCGETVKLLYWHAVGFTAFRVT